MNGAIAECTVQQSGSFQLGSVQHGAGCVSAISIFAGKCVTSLAGLLPTMPYSARFVRQDLVPISERAVTRTEVQRLLCLRGDDGAFVCRMADGWCTGPDFKEAWRVALASRSILRLNNIALFRHTPTDGDLCTSMVGPNHYFGVLDSIHTHPFTLRTTGAGMPYFVREPDRPEQSLPSVVIPHSDCYTCDSALWVSAKLKGNRQIVSNEITASRHGRSLTKDVGVLVFGTDDEVISLPQVDARHYDLSTFGARLVSNDEPFRIARAAEDPMDVVTYHFGPDYAKTLVQQGAGLFLETHDFTQIMSPVTRDSSGFITLGRWEKGNLELVGVRVPYGYSIIVDKGAIHGDATFHGSYLMAMTVNHHTMATADVVLLRNKSRKNIQLRLAGEPENTSALCQGAPRFTDESIKPLAVLTDEGVLKKSFDKEIREQKAPLDHATKTGSPVVYYPFHSGYQCLKAL